MIGGGSRRATEKIFLPFRRAIGKLSRDARKFLQCSPQLYGK